MDSHYRHFHFCFANTLKSPNALLEDALKRCSDIVGGLYREWFLNQLTLTWTKAIASDLDSLGYVPEINEQRRFYSRYVSQNVSKGNRVFVVISDALRYEVAAELSETLGHVTNRTSISARGGDSGIDITAYKDELPPRILVQVKSQDGDIKETTIQSLKGAMREGDYGLFVTLSDYTKKAQKYLDSVPIIRGINGTDLVELVLKYYGSLGEKYRRMIPLKMVYIPVAKEDAED